MSNATEDTEIQIPDDAAPAADADISVAEPPAPAARAEPAPKPAIVEPEDGLLKLKSQLDQEKRDRIAAEQRARESESARVRAQTENQDSQLHLVTTALANVKQSKELLKKQFIEASVSQDHEKMAEIQDQMSDLSAKMMRLEEGKSALEKAPKPELRPMPRNTDPVEDFVSRLNPQHRNSHDWIRQHPEFATDSSKSRKLSAAHEIAIADGHPPDSPEYFRSIEDTLRLAPRESNPESSSESRASLRRSPPAGAPVSRSGAGAGERPNVVRISKEEAEMASMMGMTVEEYARNKRDLKKEGRLN